MSETSAAVVQRKIPRPPNSRLRMFGFYRTNRWHGYGQVLCYLFVCVPYVSYSWWRYKRYELYNKWYDPYDHMRRICENRPDLMHTCPQNIAKLAEEKGMFIPPDE